MWPFDTLQEKGRKVNYRTIDGDYAIAGQIQPGQLPALAAAGFKSIICARPDHEDPGQPTFAEIERAAEEAGLRALHVPVSGMVSQGAFIKFDRALQELPKPVLGYCRSGGRAGSLYSMWRRG